MNFFFLVRWAGLAWSLSRWKGRLEAHFRQKWLEDEFREWNR